MKRRRESKNSSKYGPWLCTLAMAEKSGSSARHTVKDLCNFDIHVELRQSDGSWDDSDLSSEDLEHLSKLVITLSRTKITGKQASSMKGKKKAGGTISKGAKISSTKAPAQKRLRTHIGTPGPTPTGHLAVIAPSTDPKEFNQWFSGLKARLVQANLLLSPKQPDRLPIGECQEESGLKAMMGMSKSSLTIPTSPISHPDCGSDYSTGSPSRLNSKEDHDGSKQKVSGLQVSKIPQPSLTTTTRIGNKSSVESPIDLSASDDPQEQDIGTKLETKEAEDTYWTAYKKEYAEFCKSQQIKRKVETMSLEEQLAEQEVGYWEDLDDFYNDDTLYSDDETNL